VRRLAALGLPALLALVLVAGAYAGSGWKEINAQELKAMMDGGDVMVVFPLSRIEYDSLHIKGSVNIPMHALKRKLPRRKDARLVFYGLGRRSPASLEAARLAVKLGYTDVYAFRAGLPGWVEAGYPTVTVKKLPPADVRGISTEELSTMVENGEDFVLLDIRFKALIERYRIDSARWVNIPLDMLIKRHRELPREKKIVIIGETGRRSAVAARYLMSKGFASVVHVEGGVQKWMKDGYPVLKGS
jgi:rhodanese-related sulfurtransferase